MTRTRYVATWISKEMTRQETTEVAKVALELLEAAYAAMSFPMSQYDKDLVETRVKEAMEVLEDGFGLAN